MKLSNLKRIKSKPNRSESSRKCGKSSAELVCEKRCLIQSEIWSDPFIKSWNIWIWYLKWLRLKKIWFDSEFYRVFSNTRPNEFLCFGSTEPNWSQEHFLDEIHWIYSDKKLFRFGRTKSSKILKMNRNEPNRIKSNSFKLALSSGVSL